MCESGGTKLSESQTLEVRAELGRLLESPGFRTGKRCREFLQYIVEHTIQGPSGALKERSIGVELFQLPQDFDTSQHTIVRVTANELRKKLARHYQAENGAVRPVTIHLPPGSYSADFRWEDPAPPPDEVPATAAIPAPVNPRPWWASAVIVAGATTVLVVGITNLVLRTQSVKAVAVDAKFSSPTAAGVVGVSSGEELRTIAASTNGPGTPALIRYVVRSSSVPAISSSLRWAHDTNGPVSDMP